MRNRTFAGALTAVLGTLLLASPAGAAGLTLTPDRTTAPSGTPVVFHIAPKVLAETDRVDFNFGDAMTGSIIYNVGCVIMGGCEAIEHSFAGAGTYHVSASGRLGGQEVSGSTTVTITESAADDELFVSTAAHLPGFAGTNWRTDLEVHNFGDTEARFDVELLERDRDNTTPRLVTYLLAPQRSARYLDALRVLFGYTGAAALHVIPQEGSLLVVSRTYNALPAGSYGQFVPAIPRSQAIPHGGRARIVGLAHDPTLRIGSRTNLGFVNVTRATIEVEAEFFTSQGWRLGSHRLTLEPLGFTQLDKAFEKATSQPVEGFVEVRTNTVGARFLAYASVVDNVTGDPVFIPATLTRPAPVSAADEAPQP